MLIGGCRCKKQKGITGAKIKDGYANFKDFKKWGSFGPPYLHVPPLLHSATTLPIAIKRYQFTFIIDYRYLNNFIVSMKLLQLNNILSCSALVYSLDLVGMPRIF